MGATGATDDASSMSTHLGTHPTVPPAGTRDGASTGQVLAAPRSRFGRGLGYVLAGLPIGIPAFVIAVAGFALGVGTLVIWVGLPILVGLLAAARGFAAVERRNVEALTGARLPPHHYRTASGTGFTRLLRALRDPQSWRDLLHMVVAFPVRVASFVIAVTFVVGGAGGLVYVL